MGYEAIINAITALSKGSSQAGAGLSLLTDLGMEAYGLFDGNARRSMYNAKTQSDLTGAQQMANQFNHNEAQISRDFSEMQRQTNYQTAVNDMVAAGLNPALMYGEGNGYAASSTASAQATGTNMSARDRNMADVIGKAMLSLQMEQAEANIELTKAEAAGISIDNETRGEMNEEKIKLMKEQTNSVIQAIAESKSRVKLNGKEVDVKEAQIKLYGSEVTLNQAKQASELAEAFYKRQSGEQIQKLTPYLEKLYQANANLSNQQALTEAKKRDLYEAQCAQINAMIPYILQDTKYKAELTKLVGNQADAAGIDLKALKIKYDSTDGKYMYWDDRNQRWTKAVGAMVGVVNSLVNVAGAIATGGVSAGAGNLVHSYNDGQGYGTFDVNNPWIVN